VRFRAICGADRPAGTARKPTLFSTMLGSSLFPPPPPPPTSDRILKGYRWPASRLTRADMEKLCLLREQTGRPLTQLLQDAIAAYYDLLTGESSSTNPG